MGGLSNTQLANTFRELLKDFRESFDKRIDGVDARLKDFTEYLQGLEIDIRTLCSRVDKLEQWRDDHAANTHSELSEAIRLLRKNQQKQGQQIVDVSIRVAEIASVLALLSKLLGLW